MRTPWITTRPQTQRRKNEKIFLNRGFRRIRDPQKEKNREEEGNRVYSAMTQVLQRNGFVTSVKKRLNVLRINKKKDCKNQWLLHDPKSYQGWSNFYGSNFI